MGSASPPESHIVKLAESDHVFARQCECSGLYGCIRRDKPYYGTEPLQSGSIRLAMEGASRRVFIVLYSVLEELLKDELGDAPTLTKAGTVMKNVESYPEILDGLRSKSYLIVQAPGNALYLPMGCFVVDDVEGDVADQKATGIRKTLVLSKVNAAVFASYRALKDISVQQKLDEGKLGAFMDIALAKITQNCVT